MEKEKESWVRAIKDNSSLALRIVKFFTEASRRKKREGNLIYETTPD